MTEGTPTCSVRGWGKIYCSAPAIPNAPFPICAGHLGRAFTFANDALQGLDHLERLDLSFGLVYEDRARAEVKRDRVDRSDHQSCVYYIEVGEYIKIGYTADLNQRLLHYPPFARLLAREESIAAAQLERDRHRQFNAHLAHGNEWFERAPALLRHIEQVRLNFPMGKSTYRHDPSTPLI